MGESELGDFLAENSGGKAMPSDLKRTIGSIDEAWSTVAEGLPAWWPVKLSKAAFHSALKAKGWSLSDFALLSGVSLATISRIAADSERDPHWLLALQALPRLTRREQHQLRAVRKLLWTRDVEPMLPMGGACSLEDQGGFRYVGVIDCFESVACHRTCDLAEEGDEGGYIHAIRDMSAGQQYLVVFPSGEDWFDADQFDEYFYTTGRILSAEERKALGGRP